MLVPTIHIEQASFYYGAKCIFANLNLTLSAGKWVGLLGQSGVGKSSLLKMIAGLTKNAKTSGHLYADNHIPLSQQIAYMGQNDLLFPWKTVLENATIKLQLSKYNQTAKTVLTKQAKVLLKKVGLSKALHLYPKQLSGGMRQRVALVRTLIENKPVVLMDEPFSALDAITRYQLQNLAAELLQDKTILFITHDPNEALRLAHEIWIMQGHPATLKPVTTLTSPLPRELADEKIAKLQVDLFHALAEATEYVS